MALTGRDFSLWQGQDEVVRVLVAGGAGASAASFYVAADETTVSANRDLVMTSGTPDVILTVIGPDLQVDIRLTALLTESIPTGLRRFELWIVKSGQAKP